jgi:hypothetical protein
LIFAWHETRRLMPAIDWYARSGVWVPCTGDVVYHKLTWNDIKVTSNVGVVIGMEIRHSKDGTVNHTLFVAWTEHKQIARFV